MKSKVFFLFLIALTSFLLSDQVLSLPEIFLCPEILRIDGSEVIFNYDLTFYVYGLNPFRLKTKFGREGEGPGEFKSLIQLSVLPQYILIYSLGKISFFSREGLLIREFKVPGGRYMVPAGDGYIGYSMEPSDRLIRISVNLYDSKGLKEKSLLKRIHFFQLNRPMDLIRLAASLPQRIHYQVYDDRIFVEGEDDTIQVFDFKGNLNYIIQLDYPKRVVNATDREEILGILHSRFKSDRVRQLIKDNGFFPENFPARRFVIDSGRIYIPTFRRHSNQTQFVILDLKGKKLNKGL